MDYMIHDRKGVVPDVVEESPWGDATPRIYRSAALTVVEKVGDRAAILEALDALGIRKALA